MVVLVFAYFFILTGGPPLDDSMWHVTDYYNNIREKLKNLDPSQGHCKGLEPRLPAKLCGIVMEVSILDCACFASVYHSISSDYNVFQSTGSGSVHTSCQPS